MKTIMTVCRWLGVFILASGGVLISKAEPASVSLTSPRIVSFQASLSPTGGLVQVEVQVKYDLAGKALFAATIDGAAAACSGSVATRVVQPAYNFVLKQATVPATVVTISGVTSNSTAKASYVGPKGRTNVTVLPIVLQLVRPVSATFTFTPDINVKNAIGGTGFINADYGTNSLIPGKLTGKVTTNSIVLALKQGLRSMSFNGKRTGNIYVGKLIATAPPGIATVTNFTLAVEQFPVVGGLAYFRGMVSMVTNGTPQPVPGVTVTVRSDINGDHHFTGTEIVKSVTDANGRYQIKANVFRPRMVTLDLHKQGLSPMSAVYPSVNPGAVVVKNVALQPLGSLSISAGTAAAADGKIQIDNLPAQIKSISARVFDPNTESGQFPGEFADSQSNLLVSTVFSSIDARDATGKPVTTLGTNSLLCMQIARDSWSTLGDLINGNGQIDVPMYYYDENSGQWVRSVTDGWLEDSSRTKIDESYLASIRDGSFTGTVCAVGPVSHFSTWNIDWPISSHACISGVIVDTNGTPLSGAEVSVRGMTYTGVSSSKITGEDGQFSSDIMRSENVGEDIDRDGVAGETQQVRVVVRLGTNVYSFGPYDSPRTAGAEGTNCLNAGTFTLDVANYLALTHCVVTGQVVYSGVSLSTPPALNAGDPIAGATVIGYDPDALETLSQGTTTNENISALTDTNGQFSIATSFLTGLTIIASATDTESNILSFYNGTVTFSGCPPSPVTIPLDHYSFDFLIGNMEDPNANPVGVFTLMNGALTVSFLAGTSYYTGMLTSAPVKPVALGVWATVNLNKILPTGLGPPAGSVVFTVTSLSPLAGTWHAAGSGVNFSGTWLGQSF